MVEQLRKFFPTLWFTFSLSLMLLWSDVTSEFQQLSYLWPEHGADAQRRAEARESPRKETATDQIDLYLQVQGHDSKTSLFLIQGELGVEYLQMEAFKRRCPILHMRKRRPTKV